MKSYGILKIQNVDFVQLSIFTFFLANPHTSGWAPFRQTELSMELFQSTCGALSQRDGPMFFLFGIASIYFCSALELLQEGPNRTENRTPNRFWPNTNRNFKTGSRRNQKWRKTETNLQQIPKIQTRRSLEFRTSRALLKECR